MRSKAWLALSGVLVAAGLTGLALAQTDPAGFANTWYWQNHSVGNYVADLTAIAFGAPKLVKEWRAHREHQRKILEHLDELHRFHGIGKYAGPQS